MTGAPDSLKRWERWTGHAGYIAEGIVYLLMGAFALLADLHRQRQPNGSQGALAELGHTSIGKALLALLALGLAAFVLWQMLLAIIDPEHRGDRTRPRRWLVRLRHFCSGIFYCVLVSEAVWILFGFGAVDGGPSHVRWSSRVLQFPLGRLAVGVIGAGIGVFALMQFYRAVTSDKSKRVDLSHTPLRWVINALGAYGYICRSVLFALVALYILDAAWRFDPHYSNGIGGTLGALQHRPYGVWLLGAIAAGLMSYGLFQILKERYRLFHDS
jgi:Domain of Unknown Function (DUF1206)